MNNLPFHAIFTDHQQEQIMSEEISDTCLAALMSGKCHMPNHCLKIMTLKGLTGYQLSHQLLYSFIAIKVIILIIFNY